MKNYIHFPDNIGINGDGELPIDSILQKGDYVYTWHEDGNDIVFLKVVQRFYCIEQDNWSFKCVHVTNKNEKL